MTRIVGVHRNRKKALIKTTGEINDGAVVSGESPRLMKKQPGYPILIQGEVHAAHGPRSNINLFLWSSPEGPPLTGIQTGSRSHKSMVAIPVDRRGIPAEENLSSGWGTGPPLAACIRNTF